MKALSLVFKGVDKGALRTTQKVGKSFGQLNEKTGKFSSLAKEIPSKISRIGVAIGALSFAKLDQISDKMSGLADSVTGAGSGAADQLVSWAQLSGKMKAAGETATDVNKAFGVINSLTISTNKSFDELSGMYDVIRDHSKDAVQATDVLKKYGAFISATGYDAGEFASAVSELSLYQKEGVPNVEAVADATVAAAQAWKIGDKSADIFTQSIKSMGENWNALRDTNWALTEELMAKTAPQMANIAGALREINYQMTPDDVSGFTKAFGKLRLDMGKMEAGEMPEYLEAAAMSLGVKKGSFLEQLKKMATTDPATMFMEMRKMLLTMPPSMLRNKKSMELLADSFGLSESVIYALTTTGKEADETFAKLGVQLKSTADSTGALNKFTKQSNIGYKTFNDRLKVTREATARDIMGGLTGQMNRLSESIVGLSSKGGKRIRDLIKKGGPFGSLLKFGFLMREQGPAAAFTVLGDDILKFVKKSNKLKGAVPFFEKIVKNLGFLSVAFQGFDPVQFAAILYAFSQFIGIFKGIGLKGLLTFGPILLVIAGAFLLVTKAMQKMGITFDDFFDPKKKVKAFADLKKGIVSVLQDLLKTISDFLGVKGKIMLVIGTAVAGFFGIKKLIGAGQSLLGMIPGLKKVPGLGGAVRAAVGELGTQGNPMYVIIAGGGGLGTGAALGGVPAKVLGAGKAASAVSMITNLLGQAALVTAIAGAAFTVTTAVLKMTGMDKALEWAGGKLHQFLTGGEKRQMIEKRWNLINKFKKIAEGGMTKAGEWGAIATAREIEQLTATLEDRVFNPNFTVNLEGDGAALIKSYEIYQRKSKG